MSRKMKNLLAEKAAKQTAMQAINDNPAATREEVSAAMAELATINAKIEAQAAIDAGIKFDENGIEVVNTPAAPASPANAVLDKRAEVVKKFANEARRYFRNVMTEGTPGDGGYTVPEEIVTMVEEYRKAKDSLRSLVRVTPTKKMSGRKTFKAKATHTGFSLILEGGKVTAKASPTFVPLAWEIKKYGGYLPVTNELLEDSDESLAQTIIEWLGDEADATDNALIVEQLTDPQAVDLTDIDGIKDVLITTLGAAYRQTSKILTNDSGLSYLSTLYDGVGHPILTENPLVPGELRLQCGAFYVPVKTVMDVTMANDSSKVPFIVGDLYEAIELWDRKQISIKLLDQAVLGTGEGQINAAESDLTIFRAIVREDVEQRDTNAWVNGYITVT